MLEDFFSNDLNYIIGQIIGIFALVCAIISFQSKTRKNILVFQLFGSLLFSVHFVMIGAFVGALLNLIGILRSVIFMNNSEGEKRKKYWLWIFVVLCIGAGIATIDGDLNLSSWSIDFSAIGTYIALFPVAGMIFTTAGLWAEKPSTVRKISIGSSPCWIIYNLYNGSYAGVATEVFILSSIIIGMLRLDRKNVKSVEQNER